VSDAKVIIAGTGRAGTTLLVRVLSRLGADTGFTGDEKGKYVPTARAGFERNPLHPGAPRVVKNPALSDTLGSLLDSGALVVEHVVIPMRDVDVAAASRLRVSQYGARRGVAGGMVGTRRASQQRWTLTDSLYQLVWACVRHDVPMTFLEFPRFAADAEYLHGQLAWLVPDCTVADVRAALDELADPSLITEAPLSDDERRKLVGGAARYFVWTAPVAKIRARLGRGRSAGGGR
jgi:hypothetical protein